MASRAKEQFRIAINWYTDSRLGQFETSRSLNSLGSAYSERFEHDDAISQYKRSFELRSVLLRPNHPQLAIPLANLARELGTIGLLSEGIEKYHDAIGIFEQGLGQHHPQVAIGYGNLGTMVEDHGDLETAQIFLAHALDIRNRSLPAGHKFLIYSNMNLASLAFRRGEYNSAADYFESARVLLDSVHTSLHRLSVENDLLGAKVYLRLQNTRKSLELLRRARHRLSLYDVSEEQFLMANLAVADLYLRLGMAADAARVASDACANSGDSIGYGHYLLLECDYVLGLSRKALGSHLMAARHFSAVEDRFAEQTTNTFEFERKRIARDALGELSSYYQGEDRLGLLEKAIQSSIDLRKHVGNTRSKIAIVSRGSNWFRNAVETAFDLYDDSNRIAYADRAFRAAEQGRAGALLDAMAESYARHASIPDSLRTLEQDLRSFISSPPDIEDSAEAEATRDRLFRANLQYGELIRRFERDFPDYYDLKYNSSVASIAQVQEALSPDEVLVEYVVADSIYVFAIDTEVVHFLASARADDLDNNVAELRKGIEGQDYHEYVAAATALYDILIRPIEPVIKGKAMIVVPDGVLNYVPFEALIPESASSDSLMDYRSLPFLIRTNPVSYSLSATLLTQLRDKPARSAPLEFLGLAPVFQSSMQSAARVEFNEYLQDAGPESRTYLPGSLAEVIGIQNEFRARRSRIDRFLHKRSIVLLNEKAAEETIKTMDLRQYRFVHFATHAFANDVNPDRSGLVLATDNDSGEDGVLHLSEVYNLKLDADLVVLSACETALGRLESGEGMIGLTRGFLYAGSNNVLVSLWKADDVATRNLMLDLYQGIVAGGSFNRSLQAAKLNAINSSRFNARPYFWAQFVLHGR